MISLRSNGCRRPWNRNDEPAAGVVLENMAGVELSSGGPQQLTGRTMRLPTSPSKLSRCNSDELGMTGADRSGYVGIGIVRPQVRSGRLAA